MEQKCRIDPTAVMVSNINEKNEHGETMLHVAVRVKDKEVATVLVNLGADINILDNENNTPFSLAIETGCLEIVELLLKHNPDFDLVRDHFYTCLLYPSTDYEKIVKSMVYHGFAVKKTDIVHKSMLWASIFLGLEEIAIPLVNFQPNFLPHIEIWYTSFLLHTQPFTYIQTEMFRIITKIKDLFMGDQEIKSTGNHNLDLFKILLSDNPVELIHVNNIGNRSFNYIQEVDLVTIIKNILMSYYDSENPICDNKGRTGLHYAAKLGNFAVIQALLDMYLDINATDCNGKTPLDYAYEKISKLSEGEKEELSLTQEAYNNEKHYNLKFNYYFSLLDLKIGAILLLKHVSKLITAKSYISLNNLKTVKSILIMMNKDAVIAPYYFHTSAFIEKCDNEIELMKNKKISDLSYYDLLTRDCNLIALYTKRKEIFDVVQLTNNISQEFEIYGPMLQHRFFISNIRQRLIEKVENILFEIMKCLQLSLVIVREILNNLNNEDLFFFVLHT